jgi:hypothetical protein
MADKSWQVLPSARRDGVLFQAIDDEVIVYDTKRHKAHCLNRTAERVWAHCDGQATVADVARRLTQEFEAPVDHRVVWLAVEQLRKAHLLAEAPRSPHGLSRREVLKRLGVAAAVALPLVTSIRTPTAAQGASCANGGELCGASAGGRNCCPGFECCEISQGTFACVSLGECE